MDGIVKKFKELHAVFWGSFDPPTVAHEAIIKKSIELFDKVCIVINDDHRKQYFLPASVRYNMLETLFPHCVEIKIQSRQISYDYLRLKSYLNKPLCAVVGQDSFESWIKEVPIGHKQDILALYDQIVVVPREEQATFCADSFYNVTTFPIANCYRHVSSMKLRHLVKQNDFNNLGDMFNSKLIPLLQDYLSSCKTES